MWDTYKLMSISSQSHFAVSNTWHMVVVLEYKMRDLGRGRDTGIFTKPLGGRAHLHITLQSAEIFQEFLGGSLQVRVAALGHRQDALQGQGAPELRS